jgi:hypothetical protein
VETVFTEAVDKPPLFRVALAMGNRKSLRFAGAVFSRFFRKKGRSFEKTVDSFGFYDTMNVK